jgi:hypothetical protein
MFSAFKAAFPGQAVVPSGHLSEPAAGLGISINELPAITPHKCLLPIV